MGLYNMNLGKFVTDYEVKLGMKLGNVLTGGDIQPWSAVTEQHIMDLECEAFMSLVGEPKTQERMQSLLMSGKPLRN
jgi:3-hydroxyacyl-CoA dehydrogenase